MKISRFANSRDTTPMVTDSEGLFDWLPRNHLTIHDDTVQAKVSCPAWSPTIFQGKRAKANAIEAHAIVIDIDHAPISAWPEIAEKASRYAHAWHTAWSHDPAGTGEISVRVIVPVDRPITPAEWPIVWRACVTDIAGTYADPACRDISRLYFLPATHGSRAKQAEIGIHEGPLYSVEKVLNSRPAEPAPASLPTTQPVALADLEALAKRLQRGSRPSLGLALGRALRGEPWADHGARDNTLFAIAAEIAKHYPNANPAQIASLFERSISHFPDLSMDFVRSKLDRALAKKHEERESQALNEQARVSSASAIAFRAGGFASDRTTPYTDHEIANFAKWAKCDPGEFRTRWILQRGTSYYFFVGHPEPRYVGPFSKEDGQLAAHTYLAPASSVGVELMTTSIDGGSQKRSVQSLALDYGTVAERVIVDLTAQVTTYQSGTIYESTAPLRRDLRAEFSEDVAAWLATMPPAVEQWLGFVTDLGRPCVALFLEGAPGAGKTLLAKGCARLFGYGAPTSLAQIMGPFNQGLTANPVVLADEMLPKTAYGKGRTAELREIIQADTRPLSRKYLPDATIRGAIRLIIAANNREIFGGEDSLTPYDIQAIVGRFLHAEIGPETADMLRRTNTRSWIDEDVLARHILWIVEQRKSAPRESRFLIDSDSETLAQHITGSTSVGSAVLHWLTAFVLNPGQLRSGQPKSSSAWLVRSHGDSIAVVARAMCDHWDAYRGTNVLRDSATAKRVQAGLASVATGRVTLSSPDRPRDDRPKARLVPVATLIRWADHAGIASPDEMLGAFARLLDADEKNVDVGKKTG